MRKNILNSGHYARPATAKSSACRLLGPKCDIYWPKLICMSADIELYIFKEDKCTVEYLVQKLRYSQVSFILTEHYLRRLAM